MPQTTRPEVYATAFSRTNPAASFQHFWKRVANILGTPSKLDDQFGRDSEVSLADVAKDANKISEIEQVLHSLTDVDQLQLAPVFLRNDV
jgi:hypothetical protein